ncbi:MAG TPA: hypothetical protein VEJ38_06800 [Candidatus Acidoferrales bacterium]|nr:hypothetical protein [Candidatus Acidoferrales bacterium]
MNRRSYSFVMMAALILAIGGVSARGRNSGSYSPPKLPDGTPDFRGIWQAQTSAYVNIEGGAGAGKSVVVDPADGKIPYLPDALKQRAKNYQNRATADPAENCFQAGVPRTMLLARPFQIAQSVGHLAIVYTDDHAYRIVLPSLIPHDDGIDFFMGDSRGHWERNTLVVDVTDLGDQTWLDAAGNYHSDQLHVVERYTMLGPDTMKYEATMDDSMVYARPWTIRVLLYRDKAPGARIEEDECIDGEDGVWHHVSPTDPRALRRHDFKAELAQAAKSQ